MKKPDATCKHCHQPLYYCGTGGKTDTSFWRHAKGGRSTKLVCKKPTPLTEAEEKALAESLRAAIRSQLG